MSLASRGSTTPTAAPTAASAAPDAFVSQRLLSLDTYRGMIMVSLAFAGFGLAATAEKHGATAGDDTFWGGVLHHFSHVEWQGCGYWDMIQPSFMFMVGVSMAYSYAKRSRTESHRRMLTHAVKRSVVLVLLGIFLTSSGKRTNWQFMNVLTQIGLGYPFLFLLWRRSLATQWKAAFWLLFGTWLLYLMFSTTGIPPRGDPAVGVDATLARELQDLSPAWHKNANAGHRIDRVLLNQLPRDEPFRFNRGGYQTINFVPSLATMLFGLMCGEVLRRRQAPSRKLSTLILAGAAGIGVGWWLGATGICPVVKRIWTPSWALYSTGVCCLMLAFLYGLIDVVGFRAWTYPFVVVGANSIAIYCMSMKLKPWVRDQFEHHLGPDVFQGQIVFGNWNWRWLPGTESELAAWSPTIQAVLTGLMFWLVCLWMYRRRIFLRI